MNGTVLISGREIAVTARRRMAGTGWDGRPCWELTLEMEPEETKQLFSDDVQWKLRRSMEDGTENVTDLSEYCVAGPVQDNRNGTVTARMGLLTEREALEILLGGAV